MTDQLQEIWVYLAARPLTALTLTLGVWLAAQALFRRSGGHPLCHPVLVSVAGLAGLLLVTGTPYDTYFDGAQFIHFLLGPATVALAVPLYRQLPQIRRQARALAVALVTGSLTAAGTTLALAAALGAGAGTLASLAPKSVTTPVAMGIAEGLGGLPSLAAVAVILTGILGAVVGPWLLDRVGVGDPAARGVAIGVAAHGIGTARALQESERAGAFAGLAMGLNALATAILLPALWRLIG